MHVRGREGFYGKVRNRVTELVKACYDKASLSALLYYFLRIESNYEGYKFLLESPRILLKLSLRWGNPTFPIFYSYNQYLLPNTLEVVWVQGICPRT